MEAEISEVTKSSARPVRTGVNRVPSGVRASSMDRIGPNSGGGVRTLEKKNKQLNTATKQLEEKVKSLAQKSQAQKASSNSTGSNSNIRTTRALPKVTKVKKLISFITLMRFLGVFRKTYMIKYLSINSHTA